MKYSKKAGKQAFERNQKDRFINQIHLLNRLRASAVLANEQGKDDIYTEMADELEIKMNA